MWLIYTDHPWMRCRGALRYRLGYEDMTVTRMYVKIADTEAKRTYRSLLDGL